MSGFLKVIGTIVFVVGAAAAALAFFAGGLLAAVAVIPAMIGGAAMFGLGDIMENVADIKRTSQRQADALDRMADAAKPKTAPLYKPVFEQRDVTMRRERKLD
jgi:hypothetical protein